MNQIDAHSRVEGAADRACPMCGGRRVEDKGEYQNPRNEHPPAFDGLRVAVCWGCGLGHSYPRINYTELSTYYTKHYSPKNGVVIRKGRQWPFRDDRSIAQIMLARMFIEFRPGDRFLDVGAGAGAALHTAASLLDDPEMHVVEPNQTMVDFFKERLPNVRSAGSITDVTDVRLTLMSHCLEHFDAHDVVSVLTDIYGSTRQGGGLLVEVPHWNLTERNRTKRDAPHLTFFGIAALRIALEKAGFDVAYIATFGAPHGEPVANFNDRCERYEHLGMKDEIANAVLRGLRAPEFQQTPDARFLRAVAVKSN